MTVPYGQPPPPKEQQQQQQQQQAVKRANRRRRNLTGLPDLPSPRKLDRIPEDAETSLDMGAGASGHPPPHSRASPPPPSSHVSARPAVAHPPFATIRSASRVPLAPAVHFSPGPNWPDAMAARAAAVCRQPQPAPSPSAAAAAAGAAGAPRNADASAAAAPNAAPPVLLDSGARGSAGAVGPALARPVPATNATTSPAAVSLPLRHSASTSVASDVLVIRHSSHGAARVFAPLLAHDGTLIGFRTPPVVEAPQETPAPEERSCWLSCLLFLCCCPIVANDDN
ncbi:hypothetical protein ZHAS_00006272 [Anopheles sinensis]|uniref:Uncharacterized protein n=1 Tax=Anopheles sinensis TaxID=74873 RepID=A0A084VLV3_ANOSI|nr:hypothetical protein ZHAS_00006272 [Anopheles sinensis]